MGSRLRPPLRIGGIVGLMCGLAVGLVVPVHANESDRPGPTVDVSFLCMPYRKMPALLVLTYLVETAESSDQLRLVNCARRRYRPGRIK